MIPPEHLNQIITGDARVLAERIPDASVDLIFTDPVYSERPLYDWLGVVARRILKPAGALLCWSNGKWHRENANWLEAAGLTYRWDFACIHHAGAAPMNGKIIAKTNRVIWLDIDGGSRMRGYVTDGYLSMPWGGPAEFKWTKNPLFTAQLVECYSPMNGIVLDPFCGGGTVPTICSQSGRSFIAFEIDAPTAERARLRVANTQAMHPVFLEEQQPMELAV